MVPSPSGAQWQLSHGDQRATIVEVGGGLRTYTIDGVDVVAGYAVDRLCAHGRGQVLMPWPNRIRDGKYVVDGVEQQLAITEVPRHNASHGLVRWALWELVSHEPNALEVRYRLHPQPGWPWHLVLSQHYSLGDAGLVSRVSAYNPSATRAPFGFATHPYVATHGADAASVTLDIPASTMVEVDDRLLPARLASVEGTPYDFRGGKAIGDVALDTAFTDLARDRKNWSVRVGGIPGGPVSVWGGAGLDWVQVFSEKVLLPLDGPYPPGVAVEPMSCPADAFNSGDGLVWIEPGETWSAEWGISRG